MTGGKLPGGGAPKGNQNSKGRRWTESIDKAIKQYQCAEQRDADGKVSREAIKAGHALDAIAVRLVKEALYGEDYKFAMTEIGNRLDGKPTEHKVVDTTVTNQYGDVSQALGILREFARHGQANADEGTVSH